MIDLCNQEPVPLLSIDEALERIKAAISPITESETVDLKNGLGRVLSESLYSPINIPYERNAAMDGYAFSSQDINHDQPFTLTLVGISWAGRPFEGHLQPGQCIRIFTGAVLPNQADSVVMQEHVREEGEAIHFSAGTSVGQHIREVGEDIKQGGLLCGHPKKLSATDLALFASAGISELAVKRPVKIAFFSTGDELTTLGQPLASGKIYDSNRYLLSGLLTDVCYSVTDLGVIADNKQMLEDSFISAAKIFDVIITTGGASVGDADYVKEILDRCGDVNFWKIAIKPGKPLAFGKIGSCYFFGLPGNPVAVIVTFQFIVALALKQFSGVPDLKRLQITATCTTNLKKSLGRQEYQRGILSQDKNGNFFVASSGKQGSNILSSMSRANCYMILPAECTGVQAGDKVKVELILGADII
ncbi:MAG: gephyrin-like molybdotransferase Glp [Methylococcaceae bacterium]